MPQQNLTTTAANFQYPADLFAMLTVGGTTANLTDVSIGERVTAAGGGTAKVSAVVGTKLRLKGVKGASSTWTGALTFEKSSAAAMTASSLSYSNELSRYDSSDNGGTKKSVTEYTYSLTDKGFELDLTGRVTARATTPNNIVSAVRAGKSKNQNTDASNAPTLTYIIPADGNYDRSNTDLMRFIVTSNEALSVTGTPTLDLLFFGSQAKTATFNSSRSDSFNLVFDYTLEGDTALGQIVGAGAVTGTIVDAGTATAVSPDFTSSDVTGIIVVA